MIVLEQDHHSQHRPPRERRLASTASTFLVSALFHGALAVILAMFVLDQFDREAISTVLVTEAVPQAPAELVDVQPEPLPENPAPGFPKAAAAISAPQEIAALKSSSLPENFSKQIAERLDTLFDPWEGYSQWLKQSFEGRRGERRGRLAQEQGGTPESEKAVKEGLKWLIRHQREDGSWSFDHLCPDCDGTCQGPGSPSVDHWTSGATALALLCFLGAGQTHQEGDYQKEVRAGLEYLLSQREGGRTGGDYTKGGQHHGMYVQGFVGIALAEAYGMTEDDFLRAPARAALNFIAEAQDPQGGGWRYRPRQGGDTSVVGWQVMALTSGRIAGLGHWRPQRGLTERFLNSVQSHSGARYGYTGPERYNPRPSTTAIGLLCRLYLGWNNRAALANGVRFLSAHGPERRDMYYNYYATQLLHHFGGEHWKKWNEKMRDQLVATQTKTGHGQGSWAPQYCRWATHNGGGGRLYVTCLSILTLEVYYRHLPLYQEKAGWGRANPPAEPK